MIDNVFEKKKGGARDEIHTTVPAHKMRASRWFYYRYFAEIFTIKL
jgi:hypothetical protein